MSYPKLHARRRFPRGLRLLGFAALVLVFRLGTPSDARGDPPPDAAQFDAMPQAERFRVLEEQNAALERRRIEGREAWFSRPRNRISGPTQTLEVVLERGGDGMLFYSVPYDTGSEAVLLAVGYRKVTRAEDVREKVLYNGRMYRTMRYVLPSSTGPAADRAFFDGLRGRRATLVLRQNERGYPVVTEVQPSAGGK